MRTRAFEIVYGTLERGGHSDELFLMMAGDIADRHGADEAVQKKRFLRRLSFGTIERAVECDAIVQLFARMPVKRMEPVIRTILRMGTYELLYMDAVPAAATCNEMVTLAKKKGQGRLSGFVNAILRKIAGADKEKLREQVLSGLRQTKQKMSFAYAMPEELVQMLVSSYGEKTTKRILTSFYEERPVTIRIQTSNATKKEVREELGRAGVSVEEAAYMENALRLWNAGQIDMLPGFAEGHFTVQDESSMLPVTVAGIRAGDVVLDVCSSPGGKTFHAADVLNGTGFVSARDVSEKKLERLHENAERLCVKNEKIELKMWDAATPDEPWREHADIVFADVPCSGIGVIGKKPEIKYHAMEQAKELPALQKKIVRGAVTALKPGGTFIYSTCTIHPAENEEMAAWICEELPLELVPLDDNLPEALRNKMTRQGMLQILPGVQAGDGFFVAKFRDTRAKVM